jgi:hypothetical protein
MPPEGNHPKNTNCDVAGSENQSVLNALAHTEIQTGQDREVERLS